MVCSNCKARLHQHTRFCPTCGTPVSHKPSIRVEQDVGKVGGTVIGTQIGQGASHQGIDASTSQRIRSVESGGAAAGSVIGGADSPIHVGGQQHYGDSVQGAKYSRHGDEVRGNKQSSSVRYDQQNQRVDNQYIAARDNRVEHHIARQYNMSGEDSVGHAFAAGGCVAKTLMIAGSIAALAGFVIWMGVIFTGFGGPMDAGPSLEDYGIPALTFIPWAPIGFGTILLGAVIHGIGKTIGENRIYRG